MVLKNMLQSNYQLLLLRLITDNLLETRNASDEYDAMMSNAVALDRVVEKITITATQID